MSAIDQSTYEHLRFERPQDGVRVDHDRPA